MRPKTWLFLARLTLDSLAVLACLSLAFYPTPALAYVDPSVVTYTIQALAGVAVALSAVVSVVWRRVRRRVFALLKIDENRDKVHDPQVHEIDPDSPGASELLAAADKAAKADEALVGPHRPQNVRWLPRFLLSLLAWGCLVYTLGVVTPLEIVATSLNSFVFGVKPVLGDLLIFAGALMVVGALLLSCVRGRAFTVAISVIASLSVACLVQSTFLNTGLPIADGTPVAWDDYTKITLASSLAWIALVAFAAVFALLKSRSAKTAACVLSMVLVAVQSAGLVATWNEQQQVLDELGSSGGTLWTGKPLSTTQGRDEVSAQDNVVMFVLDTVDNKYFDEVVARYPDLLDSFTGFTWYANTSGVGIPTRYGLTQLVTGQQPDEGDHPFTNATLATWYEEPNLVDAMKEAGYNVDIYSTDLTYGTGPLQGRADNIHTIDFTAPFWPTVRELWKCSLYREAPWIAKAPFWFYSGDVVNELLGQGSDGIAPYKLDDAEYIQDLADHGLAVGDEGGKGTYRLIHMMGSHYPVTLNASGERVSEEETDTVAQTRGALRAVEIYLDELRRLGLYGQTTVIVTADHGEWYLADDIWGPSSPFLLVKPAETAAEAAEPLKVSQAPISQHDLPATLLKAMGDKNYSAWGTPVDEVPANEPRQRLYLATSAPAGYDDQGFVEWAINGDVRDWGAWSKTGRQWEIQ